MLEVLTEGRTLVAQREEQLCGQLVAQRLLLADEAGAAMAIEQRQRPEQVPRGVMTDAQTDPGIQPLALRLVERGGVRQCRIGGQFRHLALVNDVDRLTDGPRHQRLRQCLEIVKVHPFGQPLPKTLIQQTERRLLERDIHQ